MLLFLRKRKRRSLVSILCRHYEEVSLPTLIQWEYECGQVDYFGLWQNTQNRWSSLFQNCDYWELNCNYWELMVALPWFDELELSMSGSFLMSWVLWFVPGKYCWSWGWGKLCPPWQRIFEAVTLCSQMHTATRIIDMPCSGLLELTSHFRHAWEWSFILQFHYGLTLVEPWTVSVAPDAWD